LNAGALIGGRRAGLPHRSRNNRGRAGVKPFMDTCIDCGRRLDETALGGRHPQCFAERLPRDVTHLVLGGLVQVLGPLLAVWSA
jgi:hypothetical protein